MSFWLSSIGVSAPQQQQQEGEEVMHLASSGSSSTQLAEPLAIEAAPSESERSIHHCIVIPVATSCRGMLRSPCHRHFSCKLEP